MRKVLRYEVPVDDDWHTIPLEEVLHVDVRNDPSTVEVWGIPTPMESGMQVRVFGTGQPLPDEATYIGTAVVRGIRLVWHLFKKEW